MEWTLRIEGLTPGTTCVFSPEYEHDFSVWIGSPKYKGLRGKMTIYVAANQYFDSPKAMALALAIEIAERIAYVRDGVGGYIVFDCVD